ncbi:ATP-grasp fold amidoligase family protein [Natribacillus halophilus]|uniref:TupA-like ATPgrasp n=1 Tax=Natribacillus halophilus TaxID=549003 RepID=A0A1G8SDG2_9BACI|nr:ATP-grasp fold amidoligase family protein [Natribacillus halophilus]SDJ27268.1 TupA-like ATPgrasp [Natribacillus halophilus]
MQKNDSVQRQLQAEYEKEEELLQEMLQRVAELEKVTNEKKSNEKKRNRYKHRYVSVSNHFFWRVTKPVRALLSLFRSSERQQTKQLQEDNARLREQLESAHKQLRMAQKHATTDPDPDPDPDKLRNRLKMIKEDGEMLDYLDDLIKKRQMYDQNYRTALKQTAILFSDDKLAARHKVYQKLLTGLKIEEVPEIMLRSRSDRSEDTVSLQQIASFRACLTMQSRIRQLETFRPAWALDHKANAYTFIDALGIRRPWVTAEPFSHTAVPQKEGIVIKPVHGAGSRGVYIIPAFNHIQDVKRSSMLDHWDELEASMQEDLATERVEDDQWVAEEVFYENKEQLKPARDLKFYCFYGKVALILEIQRFPEVKYCWWTVDGERIHTGKYEGKLFEGDGFSNDDVTLAATISSEIPAPFIRIDFLKTDKGLVFGEFAAKPGNYDEFDQPTDRQLGDDFLEAQGRLITDLLNGKTFRNFKASMERGDRDEV